MPTQENSADRGNAAGDATTQRSRGETGRVWPGGIRGVFEASARAAGLALFALGLPALAGAQPAAQPAPPDLPEVAAPKARANAAGPLRADADRNGITDTLDALIEAGEPGEKFDVIVMFDGPGGVARARAGVGRFDVAREFSVINGFQASMTAAQIRALSASPGPIRIQENATVTAFEAVANDDIGATAARADSNLGVTGAGVTICVIDTGIFAGHEQFSDKALTSEDFKDFVGGLTQPYDDHFHGTHVAGIAAGDGGGSGLAPTGIGAAPGANLKAAKALDWRGSGDEAAIIAAIDWCAGRADGAPTDVDIISMSLGGGPTDGLDALSQTVNCAADPNFADSAQGVGAVCGTPPQGWVPKIMVVSAGNSGAVPSSVGAPGVAQNAITVASFAEWSGDPVTAPDNIWQDDGVHLSPFSSRGPALDSAGAPQPFVKPDIAAVGSRVMSAYMDTPPETDFFGNPVGPPDLIGDPPSPTAYAIASGTSMSAPQLSGVIALMLEANPSLGQWNGTGPLPHEKVRAILEDTAHDRGAPGPDYEYGHGLVDAYAAVAEAAALLSYTPTAYPGYTWAAESVADGGERIFPFTVTADDIGFPIAGMLTTTTGQLEGSCGGLFSSCWWNPDLELVVEREVSPGSWAQVPANTAGSDEVTRSECPDTGECGVAGRVELVHFIPNVAGAYRFRVYTFDLYPSDPNNATGGTFDFEISMGAPGGANAAPTASITAPADGSSFIEGARIDFAGTADDAEDGDVTASLSWSSSIDGSLGTGGSAWSETMSVGVHTITASATDSGGKTGSDSITVTVTQSDGNLPPTAGFTFGTTDRTADFTDTSTDSDGTIASWDWDFGDGNGSTEQNPSHTYAADGTYTVTLTVTDNEGATGTISHPVTVELNLPPVASFSVEDGPNPCAGLLPNRCSFTDTSSDPDGTIVSWSWDFGSGGVAGCLPCSGSGQSMLVDFPADGPNPITVSLTVTDDKGATHTESVQVWLSNAAPEVTITAPGNGSTYTVGDPITFAALATDAEDDDTALTNSNAWIWTSSIDGLIGNSSSGFTTSGLRAGTHTITAEVRDSGNAGGSDAITVVVEPGTINAHVGALGNASVLGARGRWDAVVAIQVVDADGAVVPGALVAGSWSNGANGSGSCSTDANGQCSITNANLKGNVSPVTFTVEDITAVSGSGIAYDSGDPGNVTVIDLYKPGTAPNVAPSASFTDDGCPVGACAFTDTSTDTDGSIVSWSWDFGDGNTSTAQNPSHTYAANGDYTVTLTVTDNGGAADSVSQTVSVVVTGNHPPIASFDVVENPCPGGATAGYLCQFTSTSTDPDGIDDIESCTWDYGDGTPPYTGSCSLQVYYQPQPSTTYTVTLTVTDTAGATGSASVPVQLGTPPLVLNNATGYKDKGVQHAELYWSGGPEGSVWIHRTGTSSAIVETPNTGYVDHNIGAKGGGSYQFRICPTGTFDANTCSGALPVVF